MSFLFQYVLYALAVVAITSLLFVINANIMDHALVNVMFYIIFWIKMNSNLSLITTRKSGAGVFYQRPCRKDR